MVFSWSNWEEDHRGIFCYSHYIWSAVTCCQHDLLLLVLTLIIWPRRCFQGFSIWGYYTLPPPSCSALWKQVPKGNHTPGGRPCFLSVFDKWAGPLGTPNLGLRLSLGVAALKSDVLSRISPPDGTYTFSEAVHTLTRLLGFHSVILICFYNNASAWKSAFTRWTPQCYVHWENALFITVRWLCIGFGFDPSPEKNVWLTGWPVFGWGGGGTRT